MALPLVNESDFEVRMQRDAVSALGSLALIAVIMAIGFHRCHMKADAWTALRTDE